MPLKAVFTQIYYSHLLALYVKIRFSFIHLYFFLFLLQEAKKERISYVRYVKNYSNIYLFSIKCIAIIIKL